MSLIRNEQTKLLANALDRASTACLAVGVLAPILTALYTGNSPPGLIGGSFGLFLISLGLHWIARRVLRGLVQ